MSTPESSTLTAPQTAQLAMLLEVGADPKPGNVDRSHDHKDTRFYHFLGSCVGAFPSLKRAEENDGSVGEVFRDAVKRTHWHSGGNTHFGSLLLLVPLVMASRYGSLREGIDDIITTTTVKDAVAFYEAFDYVDVYVEQRNRLDVNSPKSIEEIKDRGLTLLDIMEVSASIDGVAREWTNGFERSFEGAHYLTTYFKEFEDPNEAISTTYLRLLSDEPDTFIAKKFSKAKAREVSEKAREVLESESNKKIRDFDSELIERGINPGTTADILSSGIFINLWEHTEGLKI